MATGLRSLPQEQGGAAVVLKAHGQRLALVNVATLKP